MARIRTIKPEFWTDEKILDVSFPTRLLFIGLWNFSDDYGNILYSEKGIKAKIFPCETLEIKELIDSLIIRGMIVEYIANEQKYLHINNFLKHQKIDKPGKPQCPKYIINNDSQNIPRTVVTDRKEWKGKEVLDNKDRSAEGRGKLQESIDKCLKIGKQ